MIALDCDIPGALRIHAKCDLDDDASVPLRVSAKTGEGIAALKVAIASRLAALSAKGDEEVADATSRQTALLEKARAALEDVDAADAVLAANALRRTAEAIGAIVGKTYSDDLLDAIFSRFCVGK